MRSTVPFMRRRIDLQKCVLTYESVSAKCPNTEAHFSITESSYRIKTLRLIRFKAL